ncbi:hypothetical protein SDC9_200635 [bioreactor metagenome]|uniref:Uncharacterized protein n=1 Tax=bioreactor metagenome TaxID=1076179 RepID=A0A645IQ18_9ZZZZ
MRKRKNQIVVFVENIAEFIREPVTSENKSDIMRFSGNKRLGGVVRYIQHRFGNFQNALAYVFRNLGGSVRSVQRCRHGLA